jgi:hypothetical protein
MFRKNPHAWGALLAAVLSWSCNADLGDSPADKDDVNAPPGGKEPIKQQVDLPGGLKLVGKPACGRPPYGGDGSSPCRKTS